MFWRFCALNTMFSPLLWFISFSDNSHECHDVDTTDNQFIIAVKRHHHFQSTEWSSIKCFYNVWWWMGYQRKSFKLNALNDCERKNEWHIKNPFKRYWAARCSPRSAWEVLITLRSVFSSHFEIRVSCSVWTVSGGRVDFQQKKGQSNTIQISIQSIEYIGLSSLLKNKSLKIWRQSHEKDES